MSRKRIWSVPVDVLETVQRQVYLNGWRRIHVGDVEIRMNNLTDGYTLLSTPPPTDQYFVEKTFNDDEYHMEVPEWLEGCVEI